MSWYNPYGIFTGGVDLAAEQARGDQLDAKLQAINATDYQRGLWDATQYAQVQNNEQTGATGDVAAQVGSEFQAGLQDGLNNELSLPGKVVGAVSGGAGQLLWGILKNIPWWLWLGAAGALFVWMGGLALLWGRLAKS